METVQDNSEHRSDSLLTLSSLTSAPCTLVTIAVHPDVIKLIPRAQLIRSAFDLIHAQHHLAVDYDRFEILEQQCIGNLAEIQKTFVKPAGNDRTEDDGMDDLIDNGLSPSLLKELSSMAVPGSSSANKQPQETVKAPVLIEELWTIPTFTERIADDSRCLTVRVSLPECESVADCDVTVLPGQETIIVECSKLHTRLELDMRKRMKPHLETSDTAFDVGHLTAKFVRKTQHLILTIPMLSKATTIGEA